MLSSESWVIGFDGLPIHPNANPNCETCGGFGICEDGEFHYASVLINCPTCIQLEPGDIGGEG